MAKVSHTGILNINGSKYLLLPFTAVSDERFPFKEKDELQLRIEGRKLIVEKVKEEAI